MHNNDYSKLRITKKDGAIKEYEHRDWSDYEINYGFVIVKNRYGAWIAAYNTDCVAIVELID